MLRIAKRAEAQWVNGEQYCSKSHDGWMIQWGYNYMTKTIINMIRGYCENWLCSAENERVCSGEKWTRRIEREKVIYRKCDTAQQVWRGAFFLFCCRDALIVLLSDANITIDSFTTEHTVPWTHQPPSQLTPYRFLRSKERNVIHQNHPFINKLFISNTSYVQMKSEGLSHQSQNWKWKINEMCSFKCDDIMRTAMVIVIKYRSLLTVNNLIFSKSFVSVISLLVESWLFRLRWSYTTKIHGLILCIQHPNIVTSIWQFEIPKWI